MFRAHRKLKEENAALAERVADLERKLRLCAIQVAHFSGLHGKIKGFEDPYAPDTAPQLIADIITTIEAAARAAKDD